MDINKTAKVRKHLEDKKALMFIIIPILFFYK